jgi:uncharacterized protein (TIGR03000 family)
MYTAVLMAALTTTTASPNWLRGYDSPCRCCGYHHSYNPGCYGCYGYGYGYPSAGYGYHGGYDPRYLGSVGCYGCYGGYSCYGIPVPVPVAPTTARPPVNQPPRDLYPPINPTPKKDVSPDKDGAEEVGSPKEKSKKAPVPEEQKKGSIDPSMPIRAKVRIEVPEGGKLFVDDHAIKGPAGTRLFQTPPLAPGERYFYDIRIERAGEIHTRRVVIEPGQDVAVSFPGMTPTARVNR